MKLPAPSCAAWAITRCAASCRCCPTPTTRIGSASRRPTNEIPSGPRRESMVTHDSGGAHAHHPPTAFIWKYIFSLDHKIIGIQYILLAVLSVFVGMFLSLLMRIHLAWPNAKLPFFEGGLMTPEQYLALMTMHGTIMVFMVLTTAPQSGFGNYFLPIQIGAADMAFPVINMLSFWTTFVSLVVLLAAFLFTGGAPLSGWTAYAPLSALRSEEHTSELQSPCNLACRLLLEKKK